MEAHPFNPFTQWPFLLLMGTAILFISHCVSHFSRRASLFRRFAGPKGLPILGVSWALRKPESLLNILLEWDKKYGPTFYMLGGPNIDIISFSAPEDLEEILTSSKLIDKSSFYEKPWLGDGLLVSKGQKREERRKLIAHTFHVQLLNEQYQQTFFEKSNKLVDFIKLNATEGGNEAGTTVLEMHSIFTQLTLDILCETVLGTNLDCLRDQNNTFLKAIIRDTQLLMERYASPWLIPGILWKLSATGREERANRKILDDFTNQVIKEQTSRLLQNSNKTPDQILSKIAGEQNANTKKKITFLDFLLRHQAKTMGSPLSKEDIRDEMATLLYAGYGATASTLTWALYLLGLHDQHQQKVLEEIDQVCGADKDMEITSRDLSKLKYLEMCIKESLRLLPSVALISRQAGEDIELGHDGRIVPCGTTVLANIYLLHHNAQLYPSPFEYRPERFSTENCAQRHPFAFIPFSAGPRDCLAKKFALDAVKTTLANIFRHFTILTVGPGMKDLEVVYEIVTRPKNGVRVQFKPRSHK